MDEVEQNGLPHGAPPGTLLRYMSMSGRTSDEEQRCDDRSGLDSMPMCISEGEEDATGAKEEGDLALRTSGDQRTPDADGLDDSILQVQNYLDVSITGSLFRASRILHSLIPGSVKSKGNK